MSLKSPVGRVLGLGSAGAGTEHWLGQRLSAVALVPLTIWFTVSLLGLPSLDYWAVAAWASVTLHAILLLLLVLAMLYHSALGVQVIAEDYVHGRTAKLVVLGILRLAHIALGVAAVYAVLVVGQGASA